MAKTVISVEHLTKQYDLGLISSGTLARDLSRWWARVRGKEDPFTRVDNTNPFHNNPGESILALDDVSFKVEQGQALGIIGRNGAGKSTLLKILSRVTAPTSGVVKIKGRIGSLLEVGTGFHPELTGRENVFLNGAILGMTRTEVQRKFDEIVDFSGVEKFIDTPVKRYSSGMYVRLAFAVAAHLDPEILIVDEVLAVGDAEFQKKCLGKMGDVAGAGRTVLFVSHNMSAIERLCPYGILMKNGAIQKHSEISEVVNDYLIDTKSRFDTIKSSPHVLYENEDNNGFSVGRIEVLDLDMTPKPIVETWDTIVFKVTYFSPRDIENGSVVIKITDHFGNSLMLLSTSPDQDVKLKIHEGINTIQCVLKEIPLAGGEYLIGCGLAIPNKQWLFWKESIATFNVRYKDVYNSGLPPVKSRAIIVPEYKWILSNK